MKKNFKRILSVGLIALSLGLASCTKVTQKYADKINEAYKNDKPLTVEKVEKHLGKGSGLLVSGTGALTWVEETKDGKVTIIVTFADGKAVGAVYSEANKK